ncbi:MAG: EAL domain-containing protein, partial [Aeromonas veronii]
MSNNAGEWLKANPACYLSINISASHFESPFFLKRAYQTLHRHGIHPSQLTLEITERELIDNSCSTTRKVLQLA